MRLLIAFALLIVGALSVADEIAPGSKDGHVRPLANGGFVAWDAENRRWLDPEAFWETFAARGRGKQWSSSSEYPPYSAVNEHDTFLVQTHSGPCLMYFFHTRWRRANDVWRWGDEFNEYGGCPVVFD